MSERVTLYGGRLRTGPCPGGGYRVHATIPADATDAHEPDGSYTINDVEAAEDGTR